MNIKLKRHIVSKLKRLDEIPSVNGGGCAIVAFNLYRYLRNRGYYPDYSIPRKLIRLRGY